MRGARLPSLKYVAAEPAFPVFLDSALVRAGLPLIDYSIRQVDLMKINEMPLEVVFTVEVSVFQRPGQTFGNTVPASINMVILGICSPAKDADVRWAVTLVVAYAPPLAKTAPKTLGHAHRLLVPLPRKGTCRFRAADGALIFHR
jgi:hypothetical protein